MKEFAIGGRTPEEQVLGYRLSSAGMLLECAFGCLKARFECLRRNMVINIDDLPYIVHSCCLLHKFYELSQEVKNQSYAEAARKYDFEF